MALLEFFGTECGVCKKMEPLVERVEEELNVNVKKLEVWHNAENMEKAKKIMEGKCSSVPFFYNEDTEDFICGGADYERLKEWASGKKK